MKAPHTTFYRGKRVRIVLRNGQVIIDRFVERTGHYVVFENNRLRGRDIRSATIYKETP